MARGRRSSRGAGLDRTPPRRRPSAPVVAKQSSEGSLDQIAAAPDGSERNFAEAGGPLDLLAREVMPALA